ncbi:benzoate dioxygenase, ferredoxin reductase component [Raoultella ornithinolytica]|nr:benzoate dioxygenase, ferredoxin reductase component [Raoultella ornithinolytica]
MLHTLALQGSTRPITLLYGVTRDSDLVKTEALDAFVDQLSGYRWLPVVADEQSAARSAGLSPGILMTRCLTMAMSTSICAARRRWSTRFPARFASGELIRQGFWYEKFLASQSAAA